MVRTKFRTAVVEDVPFIKDLICQFYAKQGHVYGIPYDEESSVRTIIDTMKFGVVLVGPASCAGAIICRFPFNHRANVAQVIFWYFTNAREIKIFDALANQCRAIGATHINSAAHPPHCRIMRYYVQQGMRPAELQAMGRL